MRAARSGLRILLLVAATCRAGEVPDPLFWASDADFLEQVEAGQFVDRLELHLLQYSADPRWRSEWAAARYAGNGLFGEWGSTTGTELYLDSHVALNLFPAERFQVRYDRRDYEDGRFEIFDERLDTLWYGGAAWAVVLTGWPAFDKEYTSLGLGIRIGAPRARNHLELRVVNDRFIWNEKTGDGVRFTSDPVRLLADGFLESGPWRLHGSVDWGLPYEAEENGTAEASASRSTRGLQRFANIESEYALPGWTAGLRVTAASLERSQAESSGEARALDRTWARVVVSCRKDLGKWSVSGLAGWAWQQDDFSSPSQPEGSYSLDSLLLGVEGSLLAARGLTVRLGYLGSSQRAVRTSPEPGPLPERREDLYLDKAHLKALYEFRPRVSFELLLSQALRGGSFGGGSIKALLVF